jgi:hypothetical protein
MPAYCNRTRPSRRGITKTTDSNISLRDGAAPTVSSAENLMLTFSPLGQALYNQESPAL